MGRTWEDLEREELRKPAQEIEGFQNQALADRVGAYVRHLRQSRDMTQAELAERMDTTQPVIARLEGGGRLPTLQTLRRIGNALEIDLLLEAQEKPSFQDDDVRERTHPTKKASNRDEVAVSKERENSHGSLSLA